MTSGTKTRSINNGENNGRARLTVEQVEKINQLLSEGVQGIHIAYFMKISPATISAIKRGKAWKAPPDKLKKKEW